MYDSDHDSSVDQVFGFLRGDMDDCAFSTWIHYAQNVFVGILIFVILFCGTREGG